MTRTDFAVLYRWHLHPGREDSFIQAWTTITEAFKEQRGALGSRLHHADDGTWVAYAQWPDRGAWEASGQLGSVDPAASLAMSEAIAESFEPILMQPVCDRLVRD